MLQRSCAILLLLAIPAILLSAIEPKPLTPEQINNIITKFTEKETEFALARENYTYQQTSKIEEVDPPGGNYEIVEDVGFDSRNRRTSHVTYAPVSTLQNIVMTQEDVQDLRHVMPFVMTNETRSAYDIEYVGHEQVDEISCYVFTVKPKELTKDRKRYFEGKIWVDDQDLQIVKTYGKATGYLGKHEDQRFPKFETYRQQIDGKYWFPTYTYADDVLNFPNGQSQRVKEIVKYDHYKRFKTSSTITYGGVAEPSNTQPSNRQPANTQPANPKKPENPPQ